MVIEKQRLYLMWILILPMGIFFVYAYWKRMQLVNDNVITVGIVVGCKSRHRGGGGNIIYFQYRINGKDYIESDITDDVTLNLCNNKMINRRIPIVYTKDDYSLAHILLTREAFVNVGLPFPDSLSWLKEAPPH